MLDKLRVIATEAGKRILHFYDGDKGIEYKDDESPLTLADKASHEYIVKALLHSFPHIPIISEEGELPAYDARKDHEQFWLIDPLDGTKEFIKKNGDFTVNIALIENNVPVIGVVGVPAQNRIYSAAEGEGAWLHQPGQSPIRLQAKTEFDSAKMIAAVSRSHPSGTLDAFLKKLPGAELLGVGSSLKFCYLSEQKVDFYPRFGPLWEWDTAAAHVIAKESGVAVLQLDGQPLTYNKPVLKHETGFIAASNQAFLDYLFSKM